MASRATRSTIPTDRSSTNPPPPSLSIIVPNGKPVVLHAPCQTRPEEVLYCLHLVELSVLAPDHSCVSNSTDLHRRRSLDSDKSMCTAKHVRTTDIPIQLGESFARLHSANTWSWPCDDARFHAAPGDAQAMRDPGDLSWCRRTRRSRMSWRA